MSKLATHQDELMDEVYDTDISDEDYGFILGPDGELKALFLPDVVPFKAPKTVAKILKVLGIQDISNVDGTEPIH